MTLEPIIGDEFDASVIRWQRAAEFVVATDAVPPDWSVVLKSRAKSSVSAGDIVSVWVIGTDTHSKIAFVSDSDFGRMVISDRLRPRYVRALTAVARMLDERTQPLACDAELVAEVKGMFTRCTNKDQWDWYSVYQALGRPLPISSRRAAQVLRELAQRIRAVNEPGVQDAIQQLNKLELRPVLLNAMRAIERATPSLPEARRLLQKRGRTSTKHEREFERRVLSSYEKNKLDEANAIHQELLNRLADFLGRQGHRVEENQFVDAFCRLKSGPAIFEAKSITATNELTQTRHALSQLYEYRYRHELPDAGLWVVYSKEPDEDWIVDYLANDRDVRVIWLNGEMFDGSSVDQLTESGSTALMRRDATLAKHQRRHCSSGRSHRDEAAERGGGI